MNQYISLPAWPRIAGLVVFLFGLLAIYFTTVQSLLDRWNQSGSEYSHGPLLICIVIWLLFRERQRLILTEIKPCYWALIPAILFSLVWSAGYITQVNVVQQVALPCVIFFSMTALMGIPVARVIWFPLALIVFALPVWNVLQPPLQNIAATACAHIFSILSIPAYINGNAITVTSGTFQIATGCSGLNLFLAASLLGILLAHLNFTSRRDQVIVFLLALLVGIVCNWVRITTIILIAQFSDNIQHPIVQDHGWLGWVWFAVLFTAYLFFVNRLPFAIKRSHSIADADQQHNNHSPPQRMSISVLLVCMLSVYSTPLLSIYLQNKNRTNALPLATPNTVFGYPAQAIVAATAWHPNFHNATGELHLRLAADHKPIDFHLYLYATQSQGAELVHFENTITDSRRWHIAGSPNQRSNSAAHWWQDVMVQSTGNITQQLLLVRYWYSISGSNTTSSLGAKVLQLKGFVNKRSDAALIAISSSCDRQDCKNAQQLLDKVTEPAAKEANNIIANALARRAVGK